MDIPVTYKDIEINKRKFRINKFDARTGSYMLAKMMGILMPIYKNVDVKDLEEGNINNINITEIFEPLLKLSEEEFRYIQNNALYIVQEMLPAGLQNVLCKGDDTWGVINIEYDTNLVMNLTAQSLMFNLQGFFAGSPLGSLLKGLNLSQPNSKM